ncbi:MAG: hypothetical protein LBJ69_00195 [Holosporales bacterium]|nr:hypothetical protein [Holosporales bacterium]
MFEAIDYLQQSIDETQQKLQELQVTLDSEDTGLHSKVDAMRASIDGNGDDEVESLKKEIDSLLKAVGTPAPTAGLYQEAKEIKDSLGQWLGEDGRDSTGLQTQIYVLQDRLGQWSGVNGSTSSGVYGRLHTIISRMGENRVGGLWGDVGTILSRMGDNGAGGIWADVKTLQNRLGDGGIGGIWAEVRATKNMVGDSGNPQTNVPATGLYQKIDSAIGTPPVYGPSPTVGAGLYSQMREVILRSKAIEQVDGILQGAAWAQEYSRLLIAAVTTILRTQWMGHRLGEALGSWTKKTDVEMARPCYLVQWETSTGERTSGWCVNKAPGYETSYQVDDVDSEAVASVQMEDDDNDAELARRITEMEETLISPNLMEFTILRYNSLPTFTNRIGGAGTKLDRAFWEASQGDALYMFIMRNVAISNPDLLTSGGHKPVWIRYLRS